MATSGCPNDETFTRLVEGLLPEAEVRALEAHCDGCLSCARLLAELARSISPSGGSGGGLLDGRYRLLEPLGAGGMGVVYAAFDTKLGRKVAVKRLRETGLGTPAEKRRGRFLREAQLLASLSHPNVLTIHDAGGADRELYVVMELIDGAPVSRWLTEKRPGWRAIIDVFMQAGRGLLAAHQLGIVHRDIKPDNILVANNGRVLVGDFGLAGLAGNLTPVADPSPSPASPVAGELTETGAVLGTPAYMSPEQHDGKPGDALSDQFSFAVSLYEALHGRRPFAGRSASEIAAATRAGPLAPAGDGVPRAIDRVLSVALAPEPDRRHASMEDLLAALEQARARRPIVAALAVAALLLAGGAVGARVFLHHPAGTPTAPATAPLASATVVPTPKPAARPPGAATMPAPPRPDAGAPPPPRAGSVTPKHRRQVAQLSRGSDTSPAPDEEPEEPQAPQAPQGSNGAKALLDRADTLADMRDGPGCLAALAQVHDIPADMAARASEIRGDCEMLAGHCEAGRKILQPMYENDRRLAPNVAEGLLGARVARMCPVRLLPTVDKRVTAVYLQAIEAGKMVGEQSHWCGELQRTLLADSQSPEVQGCLEPKHDVKRCAALTLSLEQGYERLADCFLRDKNCRDGTRLDVMHSQVASGVVDPNSTRYTRNYCRPSRTLEVFPYCTSAAEEPQRKCLDHLEAARRAGDALVRPLYPR